MQYKQALATGGMPLPTGYGAPMDAFSEERMLRMQEADNRRNARAAKQTLGINNYSTLRQRLGWAKLVSILKHIGTGAAVGAGIGSVSGAIGANSPNKGSAAIAGAVAGGIVGPALGLVVAGLKSFGGSVVAQNRSLNRNEIRKEYKDIMFNKHLQDIGMYDASRFSHQLNNYIQDNMNKDLDMQSYAF